MLNNLIKDVDLTDSCEYKGSTNKKKLVDKRLLLAP